MAIGGVKEALWLVSAPTALPRSSAGATGGIEKALGGGGFQGLLLPLEVIFAHLLRCTVARYHQVWASSRLASGQTWPPAARSGL